MIVLDTNVLSARMRRTTESGSWNGWTSDRSSVWTTAVTVREIRFGLQTVPLGRRRASLIKDFERLLSEKIERRVAPFDALAAQEASSVRVAHSLERRERYSSRRASV